MLIDPQLARNTKVKLFEATDLVTLEADLQTWLSARLEETLVGLSFTVEAGGGVDQYRAFVLYTE